MTKWSYWSGMIKVEDIAFVRFRAPDLGEMRRFLDDFGLESEIQDGTLYARGAGPAPFPVSYTHLTLPTIYSV